MKIDKDFQMKVEFILGTGFAGETHKELIDLPNDYTEDDIEEMYQEWANNFLDKSWHILEYIDDVG